MCTLTLREFEQAEIAKFNSQERINYEESLKDYRDMYSVMKTQLEKGRAEGREEGIAIGEERATMANARALIEKGVSTDVVKEALGLTDQQMKEFSLCP